jgi:hypothetical protein
MARQGMDANGVTEAAIISVVAIKRQSPQQLNNSTTALP